MHLFRITISIFVTLPFFLLVYCDFEDDDTYPEFEFTNIDRSNYVDPHDMLNYDRPKIKATSKETVELRTHCDECTAMMCKPTDQNLDSHEESELPASVVGSENSTQLNQEGQEAVNCSTNTTLIELPFLGRFVKTLSVTLQIKDKHMEDKDILYVPLLAVVSKRTQFILNEITKEGEGIQLKHLADLDEILTNLLILNEEKQDSSDLFSVKSIFSSNLLQPKDWIMVMFVFSLWFVLWLSFKGYSYSYILSRSFLPFFIVCWFWHWHYMQQVASAKRHSDLSKNVDIPVECNLEKLTAWDTMRLYISKNFLRNPDPCEEYYRVLMTDPSYEVNPFVALIDMLVVGVFQPLEYIGTKIGSFFDGLLTSTGWLYKIPVLAVVLLVILMILLMCFNYEIRLPFVKLAPSASLPLRPSEATKSVQQSITGSQNVQQVPSLAPEHHRIVGHPALNVAMGDTRHQYVYEEQSVTIKRTYSQVQPVEQRAQESVEDSPEDSTIPFRTIEELVGNTLPILKASDANNQKLAQAAELVSADSAEGSEKIFEDSTNIFTSTEETCKGIDP